VLSAPVERAALTLAIAVIGFTHVANLTAIDHLSVAAMLRLQARSTSRIEADLMFQRKWRAWLLEQARSID
jgi:hypothetical protein